HQYTVQVPAVFDLFRCGRDFSEGASCRCGDLCRVCGRNGFRAWQVAVGGVQRGRWSTGAAPPRAELGRCNGDGGTETVQRDGTQMNTVSIQADYGREPFPAGSASATGSDRHTCPLNFVRLCSYIRLSALASSSSPASSGKVAQPTE